MNSTDKVPSVMAFVLFYICVISTSPHSTYYIGLHLGCCNDNTPDWVAEATISFSQPWRKSKIKAPAKSVSGEGPRPGS